MTDVAAEKPAMSWDEPEDAQGDEFELGAKSAELPDACTLGEECTACQ